jgi:hypothetical protein
MTVCIGRVKSVWRPLSFVTVLILGGCAKTTAQLSKEPAASTWRFTTNLQTTSQCLAAALNREWQGRSVLPSVVTVIPGRVDHVAHEHNGANNQWLFVVSGISPKLTEATVHAAQNLSGQTNQEKMERAAASCGGIEA